MANYGELSRLLGGSLGFMNAATNSNTTASKTGNYVLQMQQAAYNAMYSLTDRKIVFHDCGSITGPPARKATNADWLDKRIQDIRIRL